MGKIKSLSVLFAGLVLAGSAFAQAADYTLTVSGNLLGNYTASDSGFATSNWEYSYGRSNEILYTTTNSLGIHQDASGQWWQTTQYTQHDSYDYSYADASRTSRSLSFSFSGATGDQWVMFNMVPGSPLSLSALLYASAGSRTSALGNSQLLAPVLVGEIDGAAAPVDQSMWGYGFFGNLYGHVNDSFKVVAEATDGGQINTLYVYLSGDMLLGTQMTVHRDDISQWTQDLAIVPVPEPESWAMLMAGLGLMGLVARRRRMG